MKRFFLYYRHYYLLSFLFLFFGQGVSSIVFGQTVQTFTTNETFVVPAGVTSVKVECWGAGGGGSSISNSNRRGGGGGGGAYASSTIDVIPDNSYDIVVGAGGAANTKGGNSSFASTVVVAEGGFGATSNSTTPGIGGRTTNSTGSVVYAGGTGGTGGTTYSGGGGGGAGSTGAGGNAPTAASGSFGSGTSVSGGNGGASVSGSSNGNGGNNYGGGGSGAATNSSTDRTGGTGANGLVKISYILPIDGTTVITIGSTTTLSCATSGGTWSSSSPSVATINSSGLVTGVSVGSTNITYSVSGMSTTVSLSVVAVPSISASGGGIYCIGSTISLTSTSSNLSNLYWTGPNSYYSQLQNPVLTNATAAMSGTYIVTGSKLSDVNLIVNGDFEDGNVGFTSGHNYISPSCSNCGTWGPLSSEGTYTVAADPHSVHTNFSSCTDHSSPGTLQMIVNGSSTSGTVIWSETVSVAQNTKYQLSYWLQTVVAESPAIFQLYINGIPIGVTYTASLSTCAYIQYLYNWDSSNNSTATISLINKNTAPSGNDFAVDDIEFRSLIEASASVTVSVASSAPSTPGTISGSSAVCNSSTGNIYSIATVANASSYTWSVPSGWTINSGQGTTSISVTAGTVGGTISVTATNNCGTSTAKTLVVTVNPVPTVNTVTNQTYCNGTSAGSTTLSGPVSGTTFTWTNNNTAIGLAASGTGNPPAFTATNSTASPISATITVSPSANGCAGTTRTYTITVNPTPTLSSSLTPSAICNNSTFSYTPTSAVSEATFSWTRAAVSGISNTASSGTNNPNETLVNTSSSPVVVTYVYTITANGCSNNQNVAVTVYPTATVNTVTNQTYCNGTSAGATTLSGPVSGTTFTWTNNNTAIGLAASGTGNPPAFTATNSTASPISATITVSPSANGCAGTTRTYTITVNPTPTLSSSLTPSAICNNSTFSYTPTSAVSGGTFSWTRAAVSGISNTASSGTNNPNETLVNTSSSPVVVTYVYTITANGCSNNQNVAVTVYPTATVNTVTNQTYCNGTSAGSTTLSGPVSGTTFTWTNNNTAIGLAANGTGNPPAFTATNSTASPISATITVSPSANGCAGTTRTYTITVNPTPTLSSSLTPSAICNNSTFSYTPTSAVSGATFSWTRAAVSGISNTASSGTNNPNETLVNTSSYPVVVTYVYTITANGCSNNQNVAVTVYPTATVNTVTNQTYCNGTSAGSTILSGPVSGTTFTWTNNNTAIGLAASGTGNPPAFTATNSTASPISATITVSPSANGCAGTTRTYTITVNPTPTLSSSLTPSAICNNSTFSYTPTSAVSGATFSWTRAAVSGISNTASSGTNNPNETLVNTSSSPVVVTYVYTITANGCSNNQNVAVTVYPTATVNTVTNQTYCNGTSAGSTTLSGPVSGTTFTWTNNNTAIGLAASGTGNPPAFTATNSTASPISATITVSPSANGCAGTTRTYTITVNPTTQITNQSTAGQTQCLNGTFTAISITATGSGTLTYQWYSNTTANNSGGNSISGATDASYTPLATSTGTLYYYCIVSGSCGAATSAISGAFTVKNLVQTNQIEME